MSHNLNIFQNLTCECIKFIILLQLILVVVCVLTALLTAYL